MLNQPTIESVILEKQLRQDRFGKDYLLLRLENDEVLFVFPSKIKETEWDQLEEGKYYLFTFEESSTLNKLLTSFEKAITV